MQDPNETCKLAFEGKSEYVTQKAMESCIYAFNHDLHWTRKVTSSVIDCPRGLTEMTGLVPEKTDGAKKGVKVKSSTTTMEDCLSQVAAGPCTPIKKVSGKRGSMPSTPAMEQVKSI